MKKPTTTSYEKNKGGRPSAYQERTNARLLIDLWENPHSIHQLRSKISTGKYSLKDAFLVHAFCGGPDGAGDPRLLATIFSKLYADIKQPETEKQPIINVLMFNGNHNTPQLRPIDPSVPVDGVIESVSVQVSSDSSQGRENSFVVKSFSATERPD